MQKKKKKDNKYNRWNRWKIPHFSGLKIMVCMGFHSSEWKEVGTAK